MLDISVQKKDDISSCLSQNKSGFICFASFEKRCLTVPIALSQISFVKVCIFLNNGRSSVKDNKQNADCISASLSNASIELLDIENSLVVLEAMMKVLLDFRDSGIDNLAVDISTFTHESLLILLRLLYDNCFFKSVKLLYNGASNYSIGDGTNQVWLSKGCRDVKNVIGYSGLFKPSRKTHAIVLSGFEIERATSLVRLLDPDYVSIGNGIEPTDENHSDCMSFFREKFDVWMNSFQNAQSSSFVFSCSDIDKTVSIINRLIEKDCDRNYILIPLNTKLSTIAVSIVALKNSSIQVCYAVPEMYNSKNYSLPSDKVTIIDISSIFE